jgi:hypothetical protein
LLQLAIYRDIPSNFDENLIHIGTVDDSKHKGITRAYQRIVKLITTMTGKRLNSEKWQYSTIDHTP